MHLFVQISVPETVTMRRVHSMTSFTLSLNCVWLLIVGGGTTRGDPVTSPNTVMIIELGKD